VSAEGGDKQEDVNALPWWGTLLVLAFLVAGVYGLYVAGAAAVGLVTRSDEPDREEERDGASGAEAGAGDREGEGVLVVAVIDGDTVELEGIGRSRLIGVDTPEEGECYETAATRYMERTVLGERVSVAYQQERRDRFDRALVDISKSDRLIALELARLGYAEELTIVPNDRYAPRIRQAVARAESSQRGRWDTCEEDRGRARGDDDNDRRRRDRDRDRSSPAPAPERNPEPEAEPAPKPEAPSVPSGTCDEVGLNDFPVPPGDPRDRDGDGIACES
jgi:endonuclease YncB( thermonuclease family)